MASRSIPSESMTSTTAKRLTATRSRSAHILTPEQGQGYYPLEIVRKLGRAGYSSVWLARTLG